MIPLVLTEDAGGKVAIGMRQPSYVDLLVLTAHSGATLAVPDGANHVLYSSTVDFFAKYTSDAMTSSVYADNTTDGSAPELNPTLRSLKGVTGLSVIAPTGGYLTLSFFG